MVAVGRKLRYLGVDLKRMCAEMTVTLYDLVRLATLVPPPT